MTVDTTNQNLPVDPAQYQSTGLEDFEMTDAIIPRLSIQHKTATFKDNLSGQEFPELRLIVLGLTKQRILWHHNVDGNNEQPMCKSPNFTTGYPNLDAPRDKAFPWDKAGFDPNSVPTDQTGQKPLPCSNCQLKEWGTHPNGNTPYCAEQWTLSVMYDPEGDDQWVPAFLTLQKSGIKPIRSYLTSFARSNRPAFTTICRATLSSHSRGSVDYATPAFVGVGESDRNRWMEFSQSFEQMRSYLTTPPIRETDEGDGTPTDNTNTAPTQQQAPPVQQQAPAQPAQQQAAPQEDPWSGQPAPQQQAQQAPPTPQPQAQQTPPPPAQPSAPPPAAQPQQGGSDLPF